jgi:outer membrane protein assembly factor BamB
VTGYPAIARRAASATRAAAAATLLLLVTACGAVPHPVGVLAPGRWTTTLGDARNTASLQERVPVATEQTWELSVGRGLPVKPIVQGDLVIAVRSGGGITTAAAATGRRYWSRRFNGAVAGQSLRVDDRVYFATHHRDGTVYALELQRGRRAWSRRIGARAAAGAAYADGTLYIPTDRGELLALQAADGTILWRSRIAAVAAQAPLVIGDELVIATTRDSLLRVDRRGTVLARLPLAGAVSAPLTAAGDTLVLAMHPDLVAAYADRGAVELWRHAVGAPVLAAPVLAPETVYVLNRRAELFRMGPERSQRLAALGGAATESLTAGANGILVGRLDGTLFFLDRSGEVIWQTQLNGSIRAPAVVRDNAVYAATLAGHLVRISGALADR